ncbi:MAG: hypothetical protein WC749_02380 [Dehalococcoidia bacterium]
MAFRFKYANTRHAIPVLPGASTVGGMITSTCIGYLCVTGSTAATLTRGELVQATSSNPEYRQIKGIITAVPTDTTAGSTVPFYVTPILPGDVLNVNCSTVNEASTGGTSVLLTTNLGYFLGYGINTAGTVLGYGLDPSTCYATIGTSSNYCPFKMVGFSTQNDTIDVVIRSSALDL